MRHQFLERCFLAMIEKNHKKRVTFKLYAPLAHEVFVARSFNNWRKTARPLRKCKDGTWRTTINLNPGIHEYRFIVDGVLRGDPNTPSRRVSQIGIFNCVVWV